MEAVFRSEIVQIFPVLSGRNWPEIIGKNPEKFRPEYGFHKITRNRSDCSTWVTSKK
jgi:hypothetical protein